MASRCCWRCAHASSGQLLRTSEATKKKFFIEPWARAPSPLAAGHPSAALAFLVIYVVTSIMLNGSMVFYDAFLVDTTTDEALRRRCRRGVTPRGYIGSCVPFIRNA